jgi:hypothetical protein
LTGTFAPDLTLRTDQAQPASRNSCTPHGHLADRPDLRETARDWQHRIDIHHAKTDHRPADGLLIRPDAHIAWAATIDELADTAALALREALSGWFGSPLKTTAPTIDRSS